MGWTYADLEDLPDAVYDELLEYLQDEERRVSRR